VDGREQLTPEDLFALVESARELSSEIDLAHLLEHLLVRAGDLTHSAAGSVILYDPDRMHEGRRGALYFAAATGDVKDMVMARFGEHGPDSVPMTSKAGQVYATGTSLIVDAVATDPSHFKGVDQETKHTTDSMLCVPLEVGGHRLGAVQLLNKRSGNYTPRDRVLLEHFASHGAVAIRNAQLFGDLLAHKGLYTSRGGGRRVQDLVAELSAPAHRERLTVMFADMRGFTQVTSVQRSPEHIERLLNQFLTLLANEVMRHDGVVNKFLGDGILAFFRGDDIEKRAVQAAFAILDAFDRVRREWLAGQSANLSFVDVGVGIATDDDVIIGSIGSAKIKDFTVIGSAVNLAAALEHDARKGRRVLVDQPTFRGVEQLVAEFEGPESFKLRKPDQDYAIEYWSYHLKRLKPRPSAPAVVTGTAPAVIRGAALRPEDLRPYYGDSWAIVVGIDTYRSSAVPPLSYAVKDAHAMAEALPMLGFDPSRIDVLVNDRATRAAIRGRFEERAAQMHEHDRVLVFCAVHGEVHDAKGRREGFLLPYDVDPTNLAFTGLAMSELTDIGGRLPAKHVLFILDACFSGFATHRGAATAATVDLAALTDEEAVQVLSAGTSGQRAIEDGGHGIFTKHLLKGLEGWADPDGSGLTALKLLTYVCERVMRDSGNRQTPQYGPLRGEGQFLFRPPHV
jgi:class 3 adenylate cyclase